MPNLDNLPSKQMTSLSECTLTLRRDLMRRADASRFPSAYELLRFTTIHQSIQFPLHISEQIHLHATRINTESCSSDTDEDVAWSFGFLTTCGKYLVTFQVIRSHTPVSLLPLCSSSSCQTKIGKDELKVPALFLDLHTMFPY